MPHVADAERVEVEELGEGVWRMVGRYGFAEDPDVPALLRLAGDNGLPLSLAKSSFFLSRERLLATRSAGMALWREKLFVIMARNNTPATAYFRIPANRVVELGAQVKL